MDQKPWWHDKILYEIYPKSFCDANGDGIGDLGGVVQKLDYLQELGVDLLWLCPCFRSPFVDQGYDISDYYTIDPVFGTNEQMDTLLAEAERRGMSVLLDLVANHCSTEHFWFREACRDPEGKYGQYFYIQDAEGEALPTNWRSYFSGPVWSPLPGHPEKKYLHVFHEKQPDLNWENPALRQELYRMMRWWANRGVKGFRIDAIMNIKKELPLRSYPADRPDGLCSMETVLEHAHGIHDFLQEMKREVLDPCGLFTVAEVVGEREQELPLFIGAEGDFSSMFNFKPIQATLSPKGWYDQRPMTPALFRQTCFEAQSVFGAGCFPTNVIENHDGPRGVNRFLPDEARSDRGKKLLAALFFFQRGIPCLYQGQEIGMENIPLDSVDQIDDVSALGEYAVALRAGLTPRQALDAVAPYSRDNARTPMQWTAQGGFTTGTPWMRMNPNCKDINVEAQRKDPDSVLSWHREMIRLRKSAAYHDTLVYGDFVPVPLADPDLMAYRRRGEREVLVLGNFSAQRRETGLDLKLKAVLMNNGPAVTDVTVLEGCQVLVAEIEK